MLVSLSKVGHDYGQDFLFDDVSTSIDKKDKIILIGKNGCGKSTLMKIIAGELKPSEGEIFHSASVKIGYQIQNRIPDSDITLIDYYMSDKSLLLPDTQEYYSFERRVRSTLVGLEFSEEDWNRKLKTFSGGELTRISLGKLFLVDYDLLLLDEPTNHLDLESTEWLVGFLKSYQGALVVVTHDRYLIRKVGNRFWELNGGSMWDFPGDYDKYLFDREILMKSGTRARENLEKEIERLDAVAKRYRLWGQEKFIKQAINKEKQRDRLIEQLESLDLPDEEVRAPRFRLPQPDRTGYIVLKVEGLSFGFEGKELFRNAGLEVHRREKLGLLGPNGSGKTTLLKIITQDLEKTSGEVEWGHNVRWGYLSQLTEDLNLGNDVLTEIWQLMPGQPDYEVRKYIGRFGFPGEDVFKPISSLSGGEKTKLALAKLILSKPNVLVMDEPTNNLDIWSIKPVRSVQEYLNRNRTVRESNDNEASRLSFQEKRKLTNRRKSLSERYDLLHNEEEELSRKIEQAQLKMGLYVTNYEKLQEFQAIIESSEEKILALLEEKENLERELEELDNLLGD